MTIPDDARYDLAVARIVRVIGILAGAGTLIILLWRGWQWAAGFALGAAISWVNFRWLKRITDAIGGAGQARPQSAVILGLRYLLLGGGAYVILRYSSISLPAALLGLFVSVAAVIFEILIELVYARNR